MQVKDTLSGIGTDVGDETVAALIYSEFVGKFGTDGKKKGENGTVLWCQLRHGRNMAAWDE